MNETRNDKRLELNDRLARIAKFLSLERFANHSIPRSAIVDYYTQSRLGYTLNSRKGAIHLTLSTDGRFRSADVYQQAARMSDEIEDLGAKRVLEVACGKGFNTLFLAHRHPQSKFIGIDITPHHLEQARKRAARLSLTNILFESNDFHNITYPDEHFDYVFEVEGICHAQNIRQVLEGIYRVLRPGGVFTSFNGWRHRPLEDMTEDEQLCTLLIEKSMALPMAWTMDEILDTARSVGFRVRYYEDLSAAIMPNLRRFESWAEKLFRYLWLGKLVWKLLPNYLVQNAIAGYLLPLSVEMGIRGYWVISLAKDSHV